jgi:hypothetical protein
MGGQGTQRDASVVVGGFLAIQGNFQSIFLKALTECRILRLTLSKQKHLQVSHSFMCVRLTRS